jgi:ADP-ribosylglycohydrolase
MAADFGPTVTNTALFLYEAGIPPTVTEQLMVTTRRTGPTCDQGAAGPPRRADRVTYALAMMREAPVRLSAVRGGLLGLALGDAVGVQSQPPRQGVLPSTCAGQLACFTVDGIIRASVRFAHKGICHPPSVVWHAYTRWAAGQGITGIKQWQSHDWPDGWLTHIPALQVRRGSAPATVAALRGHRMGTPDAPAGASLGAHALTRSLPAGLAFDWLSDPVGLVQQIAATTHAVDAAQYAALGATILARLTDGHRIDEAIDSAQRQCADHVPATTGQMVRAALTAARSTPADVETLRRLASDARASSALAAGLYTAVCFPDPTQVRDALMFAATAQDGGHAATVAGAFLGAAHGVDALPVDLLSRLELAWVADVLAHDLVSQFIDGPSGSEYAPAADRTWWNRYPGW